MNQTLIESLVGAVVLAVAIAFGVVMTSTAGLSLRDGGYTLQAQFRSVEGVSVGSDVRLAGVKVGTVAALELDPETFRARTVLALDESVQVPDDSAVLISSEGLLGGNFVEISPGGSPFYFSDGDEIFDTQGAVSLITLLLRYVGGGGDGGE